MPRVGGGVKGFDFTKLDGNGNPLPASAGNWTCVRDNVTGLEWEVKTDDGGLRDKDWLYSCWTLDKPNSFPFEKAVIPAEPARISERLKPPFSGETGV